MNTTSASAIKKLLLLFLAVAGLYYAKAFLMPLATGAVLAALFLPFCKWMEEKKLAKGLAALVCVFTVLLLMASVVMLLKWQVSELTNDVGMLKQKGSEMLERMRDFISGNFGITAKKQEEMLKEQQDSVGKIIPFMAGSVIYVLTTVILTLVYLFLLLYYRLHIREFILKLFPPAQRKEAELVIYNATNVSQQYMLGLAKMIFCLWVMYSIGFSIVGVKNAFFYAILCGLLEIVPYIGNITGNLIVILVSAVQGASPGMLGGIVIVYATVQFLQGWVIEPLIVGPQVKINPMATIFALVLGELIWGIPGVVLAIPLTAMFKIVCDHVEPLKPYGFLIGEIKSEKKESALRKKLESWFRKSKR
jgi:predicted PurR-regulated permease PerM